MKLTYDTASFVPWKPATTEIPFEWQEQITELHSQSGNTVNAMAGMHYDGQGIIDLLRSWELPWQVVVAGALLFHSEKKLRTIPLTDASHIISHIQQAKRYIDCIKHEDLSALLTPPYRDLGALLIAVASCYLSLEKLQQRKGGRILNQREVSRVKSIGDTLIHITKQVNLWLFKRDIEDLVLQLRDPAQYASSKEELQRILQPGTLMLDDFCRAATAYCEHMIQKPILITYSVCGVAGLARRHAAYASSPSQKTQLTGFDLAIFDVIVPTVQDCYLAHGLLSQLGHTQDNLTDRIANPKLNGSSYLAFGLILKREPYLNRLSWIIPNTYVCQIQIATRPMHAVTHYGCLYPACYQLYIGISSTREEEELSSDNFLTSEEGNIYASIRESFRISQSQRDANAPIVVYDKKLTPVSLPKGATVLDFAYACGEHVGEHAVTGRINDRPFPLHHTLDAGDIVEIINSDEPQIQEYWIEQKYVTTAHALQILKEQLYSHSEAYALLRKKLAEHRYRLNKSEINQELAYLVKQHQLGSVSAYLEQLKEEAESPYTPDWAVQQIMQQITERHERVSSSKPNWIPYFNVESAHLQNPMVAMLPKSFCGVCQPTYPRDINIVGHTARHGKELVIHSVNCSRLPSYGSAHQQQQSLYPLIWLNVAPAFRVAFFATAQDRRGLIFDLSRQLLRHQCVLVSFDAEAIHHDAQIRFIIEIYNKEETLDILQKIKKVKSVTSVEIDRAKTDSRLYEQLQRLLEQSVPRSREQHIEQEDTAAILGLRRSVLQNPFNISRSPDEKMFFGRSSEIEFMYRELCAGEQGKAIFLHGPRRSGKSSLCKIFLERHVHPPYWHVQHSLQGMSSYTEEMILAQLAEEICRAFWERFEQRPVPWEDYPFGDPQMRFKHVLQGCLALIPGSRLVLTLDEFGGTLEAHAKGVLDERFFTYWRNLMNEVPQLSLIFILPTIPHGFLTSSQLANAFSFVQSYSIDFLDEASATQLLIDPLREQNIDIRPHVVKRALEIAGRNPYYLTLIGNQLISQLNWDAQKTMLTDEDLTIAVDHLIKWDTKQNFYFYRDELHQEEFSLLEAFVDLTQQSGQPTVSLQKITKRLQESKEVIWSQLNRLQQGLILREQKNERQPSNPYYSFAIELVRLWMARNSEFFSFTH